MASKKVFYDKNGNELIYHVNIKDLLFLSTFHPDDPAYGYICLEKQDVEDFIEELKTLKEQM